MRSLATFAAIALVTLLPGCSPPRGPQITVGPGAFSDDRIETNVAAGAEMKSMPGENSYLLTVDGESFFLTLRGAAESDELGRQRTEASQKEVSSRKGVSGGDEGVTVTEVSEVLRHEIEGEPVYAFHITAESGADGETKTEQSTMGFGSLGGEAIWFQHTGPARGTHPDAMFLFLGTITFKGGLK